MCIIHLAGQWDDKNGNIYLGAFIENTYEKGENKYSNVVVVFSPDLSGKRRINLAV